MAAAASLSAQSITVTIQSPAASSLSDNPLAVVAVVASVDPLATVTASVLGSTVALSFSNSAYCDPTCHAGWVGSVPLTGIPRGAQTVTVVAQDINGRTGQAQTSFTYDQKPVLTVTAPIDHTVARPWIHVAATCADDDPQGCTFLRVYWINPFGNSVDLATGTSTIDATVSLAANEGNDLTLHFEAVDSAHQGSTEIRFAPVDSSSDLYEIERVGGLILDVQPDRILFRLGANQPTSRFVIHTRATGVDELIDDIPGRYPSYGFLTATGGLFVSGPLTSGPFEVDEWRNGGITALGTPNSTDSLRVKGDYAIWSEGTSLYRYTISSQTKTLVTARPVGNLYNDVAANGDVAYWTNDDYQVFRYRGGINTQLTNDAGLWNTYVLTDGTNVVYRKSTPCCAPQTWGIALHDGISETILEPLQALEPQPGSDYVVSGGWTGFTKNPGDDTKIFWVRSPTGTQTALSPLGSTARADYSISSDGQATFIVGARRFLASPSSPASDISTVQGLPVWESSRPKLAIGRSLFDVGVAPSTGSFFTLAPCRVIDTRLAAGPLGGPALAPGIPRSFPVAGTCGIPAGAKSIAVNVAVTQAQSAGFLTVYPGNGAAPVTSAINFAAGQTRSNNAVALLATDGSGTITVQNFGAGTVHLILDVSGYFQ
jgi:hypothetical protein